jgi:uncharacterized surface protein with fasciclin (FAS1) repeats
VSKNVDFLIFFKTKIKKGGSSMKLKIVLIFLFITVFLMSSFAFGEPRKRFQPGDQTIAEIASADPDNFSTLVAALICTDLVGAVNDPMAELTVFAPTNEAFGTLELDADNICTVDNDTLTEILLYHVVGARRPSPSVINGKNKRIKMLAGGFIYPEGGGSLNLEDNTGETVAIAAADVMASNGIIHVISGVLFPFEL